MITLKEMKKADRDVKKAELSEEEKEAFAEKFRGMELFKNLDDDGICSVVLILS